MDVWEVIIGITLTLVLWGLAGWFAFRQFQAFRGLTGRMDLSHEERRHHYKQASRRLACAFLMALFGGMILGWFYVQSLIPEPDPVEVQAGRPPPVVEFIAYYWIVALLVLFGLLVLAVVDFVATARFGLKQHRAMEKEHRALLEEEAARLRRQREARE